MFLFNANLFLVNGSYAEAAFEYYLNVFIGEHKKKSVKKKMQVVYIIVFTNMNKSHLVYTGISSSMLNWIYSHL